MKNTLRILSALLALLLLSACAAGVPAATTTAGTSAAAAAGTAAPVQVTTAAADTTAFYDPTADYPYGAGMSPFFQNFVPTENGYYMLLDWFLFYMDADAMEPVPVCNRPNCMHYFEPDYANYQACNAYWDSKIPVTETLSWWNEKLWYIGGVETIDDPDHHDQAAVMRMDPDGMNREIVYRIDPTVTVPKAILHRGVFYYYTRGWNQEAREQAMLWAMDLRNPRREPECLLSVDDHGGLQALTAYGDKLYFYHRVSDEGDREFCIFDLNTREMETITTLDGVYSPLGATFIGDSMYLIGRMREPQGDPNDARSYPERLYRCGLDGSDPTPLLEDLLDYCADQRYLYGVPPVNGFNEESHHLRIFDPAGQPVDSVDLYKLVDADKIRTAGLLIPPGDRAMLWIRVKEKGMQMYVYWFDKSEIGSGQIGMHPLLSYNLNANSDMRGEQMIRLDTEDIRSMGASAASTTMAAATTAAAPATTAPAAAVTTTAFTRPANTTAAVVPVDMGPFTNAAGLPTGSIQVEDLGIDLGGKSVEFMTYYQWGQKLPREVEPYWENVCEYIAATYNGNVEMRFPSYQEYKETLRARIDAGEAPDVFHTLRLPAHMSGAYQNLDYDSLAAEGALLALDDYVPAYLSRTCAKADARLYDALTRGGSLYGTINYQRMFKIDTVLYDKAVTDAAGVEIGPWTHYSDLWEPMRQVRAWTDENLPDRSSTATAVLPIDWVLEGGFDTLSGNTRGCIGYMLPGCESVAGKTAGTELFNIYDCPEFPAYLKNVSQLVSDRVLREGNWRYINMSVQEDAQDKNVKLVFWYDRHNIAPLQETGNIYYASYEAIDWTKAPRAVALPEDAISLYRLTVVSAGTKAPEAACGLIEILNNDLYVGTTLRYGLEGENWARRPDGHINKDLGRDSIGTNLGLATGGYDEIGDITNALIPDLTPIRLTEILDEGHAKLLYADSLGFMADHRPVQAEYEAVDAVMDEYLTEQVFYSGLLPPERIDALFAEFIEKLNAAGVDRIREEYQRQLDAWMAGR